MSYPDNMTVNAGPYAPRLRSLDACELLALARLEAAVIEVRVFKHRMACLAPSGTDSGPEHASFLIDEMLADLQSDIDAIEARPYDEFIDGGV